ncbi:MAG: DUF1127 domain-containing protein [Kiloniellaceae bacterium]
MYRNLAMHHEAQDLVHLFGKGLTSAINVVRSAADAILRWHKRRIAIRELMALDDGILRDIGMRRDDIYSVANARSNSLPRTPAGTPLPEARTMTARERAEAAAHGSELKFLV